MVLNSWYLCELKLRSLSWTAFVQLMCFELTDARAGLSIAFCLFDYFRSHYFDMGWWKAQHKKLLLHLFNTHTKTLASRMLYWFEFAYANVGSVQFSPFMCTYIRIYLIHRSHGQNRENNCFRKCRLELSQSKICEKEFEDPVPFSELRTKMIATRIFATFQNLNDCKSRRSKETISSDDYR